MSQPIAISPSLLAADFARLADQARAIEAAGADSLHLDLMDGRYVPNLSFGPLVVAAIRPHTRLPFDAHLMVEEPEAFIEGLRPHCRQMTVHPAACRHVHRALQKIRNAGMRAGVALNPGDSPDAIPYLGGVLDSVLIMSVNPGYGGQAFIAEVVPKIREVARIVAAFGHDVEIAVDGGVGTENAAELARAGATTLIAGTALFCHDEGLAAAIDALRAAAKE